MKRKESHNYDEKCLEVKLELKWEDLPGYEIRSCACCDSAEFSLSRSIENDAGRIIDKNIFPYPVCLKKQSCPTIHPSSICFLFGCSDGLVHIYKGENEFGGLATKAGPVEFLLVISNILNLSLEKLHPSPSIVTGASDGMVTFFFNGEIFARHDLLSPVTALVSDTDATNNSQIVVGDRKGFVTIMRMQNVLYRFNIGNYSKLSSSNSIEEFGKSHLHLYGSSLPLISSCSVSALHSCNISDMQGSLSHYLVVCDTLRYLHFFVERDCVGSLLLPGICTTICGGEHLYESLLVGCDDGYIYLINAFEFERYIDVGYPIRKLCLMKKNDIILLLCIGEFNALLIYHRNKLILNHPTEEWVLDVSMGNENCEQLDLVVVLRDSPVHIYKVLIHIDSICGNILH